MLPDMNPLRLVFADSKPLRDLEPPPTKVRYDPARYGDAHATRQPPSTKETPL